MKRIALILALSTATACHAGQTKEAAKPVAAAKSSWSKADVEAKIAEIEKERNDFQAKAQQQLVAYEGAIQSLKALISQPAPTKAAK